MSDVFVQSYDPWTLKTHLNNPFFNTFFNMLEDIDLIFVI